DFVTEMAAGKATHGHDVHVFVPQSDALQKPCEQDGVTYHPMPGIKGRNAVELARSFARAAQQHLADLPPFDLIHLHEWMTGLGNWVGHRPTVLSLASIEAMRRNGQSPPDRQSLEIEKLERQVARAAGSVLTPAWLRDKAVAELGLDSGRVHPFSLEGRLPNEWEAPLDIGRVKMDHGIGPLDRMVLYIG